MTPYFDDGAIQIWCGDCRDVLPLLPTDSADLLLTDPPYGVSYVSGRRDSMGEFGKIAGDDGSLDVTACLRAAFRVLRNHRHVYVFGPDVMDGLPVGPTAELIWDKGQHAGGNTALPWSTSHERITFAVHVNRPKNRAENYGIGAARLRRGTVLRYQRHNSASAKHHPTEKPVDLMRELIEMSSRFGETVLDPFMGAGSTMLAAQLECRKAIGIEVDERYCEMAVRRLRGQTVMPLEIPA